MMRLTLISIPVPERKGAKQINSHQRCIISFHLFRWLRNFSHTLEESLAGWQKHYIRDPFVEHIESHIIEFTNTIKSATKGRDEKFENDFPSNEIRGLFTITVRLLCCDSFQIVIHNFKVIFFSLIFNLTNQH